MGATVYHNDYIELAEDNGKVMLHVLQDGYSLQDFNNEVPAAVPRMKVTKFNALSTAIREHMTGYVEIGDYADVAELNISSDNMTAQVTILLTDEEYAAYDKKQILAKVVRLCKEKEITYGLDADSFVRAMRPLEPIEIATGLLPENGRDAEVTMYEISEVEPTLEASGEVDHYEMNVINRAVEGDWLGERQEPTEGIPGKDIYGHDIDARPGIQKPLLFDPNTVISVYDEEEDKTTLKALKNGAIIYQGDTIMILNAINIDGDVSFATGNIDFDGFVEITETVEDNFSVVASGNIQILGDMGIGAIDLIESREGDVYIRGGIAGKGKAHIKAKKNIYTKFASDCTMECGGTINIGFYAMNCTIKAKEIIMASQDSKLIGGSAEADVKINVGELGSRAGIHTKVRINGFDRVQLEEDYSKLNTVIELTKEKEAKAKSELDAFGKRVIRKSEYQSYETARDKYRKYSEQLKNLYEAQKNYVSYLRSKGCGEVVAGKGVYQNVFIEMGDDRFLTDSEIRLPMHYFFADDEIKGRE